MQPLYDHRIGRPVGPGQRTVVRLPLHPEVVAGVYLQDSGTGPAGDVPDFAGGW